VILNFRVYLLYTIHNGTDSPYTDGTFTTFTTEQYFDAKYDLEGVGNRTWWTTCS